MKSLVPARTLLFLPSFLPSLPRSFVRLALVVHGGSVDAGAQSSRAVVVVVVVVVLVFIMWMLLMI